MSQVRTSMQLIFRDIIKYFASFDYKKDLKIVVQ